MTWVLLTLAIGFMMALCITLAGWFGTAKFRYLHQERMTELGEQAKLNAIEVESRSIDNHERQLRAISAAAELRSGTNSFGPE